MVECHAYNKDVLGALARTENARWSIPHGAEEAVAVKNMESFANQNAAHGYLLWVTDRHTPIQTGRKGEEPTSFFQDNCIPLSELMLFIRSIMWAEAQTCVGYISICNRVGLILFSDIVCVCTHIVCLCALRRDLVCGLRVSLWMCVCIQQSPCHTHTDLHSSVRNDANCDKDISGHCLSVSLCLCPCPHIYSHKAIYRIKHLYAFHTFHMNLQNLLSPASINVKRVSGRVEEWERNWPLCPQYYLWTTLIHRIEILQCKHQQFIL